MTNKFKPNTEGIFQNLPAADYHNHKATPEVSRGIVVRMISQTPQHVRAMIDGLVKKEPTDAMISGTMIDMALLEPDKFKEGVTHYVKPAGLNLTTSEGREWKKDHPLDIPRIPAETDKTTEASIVDIKCMIESVMRHKVARKIVERGKKQESAFAFDKETGLLRKCRSDSRLQENSGRMVIGDLKSTEPGGTTEEKFSKKIVQHGLFVQNPFYSDIYKDLCNGESPFFLFFVVERKPPYTVRVFQLDSVGIEIGRSEIRKSLNTFAKCKAENIWPDWQDEDGIKIISLPRWKIIQADNVNL